MGLGAVTESKKVHYSQIDALKGIAIFLVILGHGIILFPINLHRNTVCNFIFRWLSSVHMPLLFLISGFCFSYKQSYKIYIWKKIKRILIPYIVFNAIDFFPRAWFPNLVNRPRGIIESIVKILFNGGEYWFLYTLFVIFLIYPFLCKFIENNIYISTGSLAVILLLHFILPPTDIFTIDRVIYYLFYFISGRIIKNYK